MTHSNLEKEFQKSFETLSDQELIERLNREVNNKGWTNARAIYLHVMRNEFNKRQIELSNIVNSSGGFNLNKKVKLVNHKVEIIED